MLRLIAFILIFALFLAFIVFNLENKSDVSVGFATFENIPVFLTAFSAFVLGLLFSLPFALSIGRKRKKSSGTDYSDPLPPSAEGTAPRPPDESETVSPKKGWGFKKKAKPPAENKVTRDESFKLADQLMRENNPDGLF
jgi:hypothetical protein